MRSERFKPTGHGADTATFRNYDQSERAVASCSTSMKIVTSSVVLAALVALIFRSTRAPKAPR